MYEIYLTNKKVEWKFEYYLKIRKDMKDKLMRLKINPRKACAAHQLHGELKGKWACWLGSNIRMVYVIDDQNRILFVENIGTHKVY